MGILPFILEELHSKPAMELFNNPSKRIRLDLSSNYDGNLGNDDLWGAEDITADEFDYLEVQATQSHNEVEATSATFRQPYSRTAVTNPAPLAQTEEMKQQQYELEGKVKLLSDSLEKISKELKEEKLNRDKVMTQKTQDFQEKESLLHQEIKKMESVLQFKNQEMKTVYDKVRLLETQLKDKKEVSKPTKTPSNFKEKFNFATHAPSHSAGPSVQVNKPTLPSRKYKLLVDAPRGSVQGTDIVSSILCNRLVTPDQNPYFSPITPTQTCSEVLANNSSQISALSVVKLNSDCLTQEIFDYFICVIRNYLMQLKTISSRNAATSSSSTSPLRKKETPYDQALVISCLKDLTFILSCPQFLTFIQKLKTEDQIPNEAEMETDQPEVQPSALLNICNRKILHPMETMHSLLQLLASLLKPDTYPVGFPKSEEIEWSLAAIVSWSSSEPKSLLQFAKVIPFFSLINCYCSVTSLHMSLKLLSHLCIHKEFIPRMVHKRNVCVLCALASVALQKVSASPLEFRNVMLMIEDIFSSLFTTHSFSELNLESSPCSSLILQSIVTAVWRFCGSLKDHKQVVVHVLKKGFTLVHLLSRCLSNFKGRRAAFEDTYISLVCKMLTLSKENSIFKDFHDLVHDLWDFQDDMSEFDLDEPSEDSQPNVELPSQDNH